MAYSVVEWQPTNEQWNQAVQAWKSSSKGIIDVQMALNSYKHVKPSYGETYTAKTMVPRIMAIALFIIGTITLALFASNHLLTFPQDFLNLFHNINYIKLAITAAVLVTLFSGASIIIHRARHKKEPLLAPMTAEVTANNDSIIERDLLNVPKAGVKKVALKVAGEEAPNRGALTNLGETLKTARFVIHPSQPTFCLSCFLDFSTLDPETKTGNIYAYHYKNPEEHYFIASVVAFVGTPIYLACTIVYNILRAVIAPLYVIIQLLRELAMEKDQKLFPDERRFEPADIGKQFCISIQRALQAPFYALAYFMAVVYGFFNPMGGRKLAFHIETDWNGDGLSIDGGYWSVRGPQDHWKFEGGGGPDRLGDNGFSLAGCYWPTAIINVKDGEIKGAYRMSAIENPIELAAEYAICYLRTETEKAILEQAKQELEAKSTT